MDWNDLTNTLLEQVVKTFNAKNIVYHPVGQDSVTIRGVLSNAHVEVDIGEGMPSSSFKPVLFVKLSDLPQRPKRGDRVEVNGKMHRVIDSQEDGEGGSTLVLNEQ